MIRILAALALACASAIPSAAALAAVNINSATRDELVAVPGIGPTKAQAIVDHRAAHGPFKSVDDLKGVKGFREKLVERLRPELTVSAVPAKGATPAKAAPRTDGKGPQVAARADAGRIADEKPRK